MDQHPQRRALSGAFGTLEYTLTRKKVKNLNLRIHPDGEVLVSAPFRLAQWEIDRFLLSKIEWIHRVKASCPPSQTFEPSYRCGQQLLCLGRSITLLVTGGHLGAALSGDTLRLTLPDPGDREAVRRMLKDFSDQYCRQVFSALLERVYPLAKSRDVPFPQLRIRLMRSRWGSCTPGKKAITLNKALVQAPVECIEYVIVHELAHFLYPDHSSRFHRQMDLWMPDWRQKRARLKEIPTAFWYDNETIREEEAE